MALNNRFFDCVDFFNFDEFDEEESLQDQSIEPVKKQRGRPPLVVQNPLDGLPRESYITKSGQPTIWLDDALTGAIRIVGDKDRRKTTKNGYVSFWKVFRVLVTLRGPLTPKRVSEALGVSHNMGWRIVTIIIFLRDVLKFTQKYHQSKFQLNHSHCTKLSPHRTLYEFGEFTS